MPKLKTKSGSKKRFKKTSNGYIKKKHAFKNHLLTKKSKKRKRKLSTFSLLKKADQKNIKKQL
ncbi:50S ribosomal protein L35 [Blattabacterium sp. (Cryptocercus kyebangensis)]|uniref:50S ribosomal protein L35 n=1 Tax=Blattabacterium sp. (Cryptocercus kyebangensis) TaxID=298656 RepID=UPI000D7B9681|nr:50S ribosomal protein L35 [Blattabacterium sp. (Cryptocercus kyebangensis)]AWU43849.1 50S ribosomal protein L35 [Blattabacterium sp. (Cryptocercus kyebangensis)]